MLAPTLNRQGLPILMCGPELAVVIIGQPSADDLEHAALLWAALNRGVLVLC